MCIKCNDIDQIEEIMCRLRQHNYASKPILCFQKFINKLKYYTCTGSKIYNRKSAVVEHKLTMCYIWLCLKPQQPDHLRTLVIVYDNSFTFLMLVSFCNFCAFFIFFWLLLAHIQCKLYNVSAIKGLYRVHKWHAFMYLIKDLNDGKFAQLVCVPIITKKKKQKYTNLNEIKQKWIKIINYCAL